MAPSHVLVPLDGSPLARAALSHALETYDCRVTVLNVVTPLDATMSESGPLGVDDPRREEARERAAQLVEEVRDETGAADRPVEVVIESGEPAETILAHVDATDADLVVMGAHGGRDSELARRLLGTVTTRVVSESPVTVTVVEE